MNKKYTFRSLRVSFAFLLVFVIASGQVFAAADIPRLTDFSKSIFAYKSSLLAADQKISSAAKRNLESDEPAATVIMMADQADVSDAYTIVDQDARGWFVYRTLADKAEATQSSLKAFLAERNLSYTSFWAANMLVADLDMETAVEIAGRSDVARIDSNAAARWIEDPEIAEPKDSPASPHRPDTIEWGVSNVNAPAVWSQGFSGAGIVVGGQDTGIRWTHNAIKAKYRGWNGTTADHNYNWHDSIHTGGGSCGANTTAPCDDSGHGSHTVGTMVGDDGSGNQIGVAPGAKWIGCRNMNVGNGTPASYAECFQFMIAPTDMAGNNANPTLRPHILNNSWGCPASEGCTTRAELETIVNNTLASGIFVQSSAGNTGPNCSSLADAIAIYDGTFAAANITSTNSLNSTSSRGPSTYYTPGLTKPNIAAPGTDVRSIYNTSDTTYQNLSGTSMASPHVAGVIALLWSARPALVRNIAATKALLTSTANPAVSLGTPQTCGGISSTQIPNNAFGYGRVDALAALNAAPNSVTITGRVLTSEGVALRNAVVTRIDSAGNRQSTTTSSFGVYTFSNVSLNASYTLTVSSKRYRYTPQSITTGTSNFAANDFVGLQ